MCVIRSTHTHTYKYRCKFCICEIVMPYVSVCCNKPHNDKKFQNIRVSAKIRNREFLCCVWNANCGCQLSLSLTSSALPIAKLSQREKERERETGPAAVAAASADWDCSCRFVVVAVICLASPFRRFRFCCRCRFPLRCRRSGGRVRFVALRIPISCQFASN